MITEVGLTKIANAIIDIVDHGAYDKDGQTVETPIHNIIREGNVLKVYLYIDDTVDGELTNFRLIDVDGEDFKVQDDSISKSTRKGLLIMFKINISGVL